MTDSDPNLPLESRADLDAVEALMVRCLDGPEEGWPAALDAASREHPEHAEELRRRLDALVAFEPLDAEAGAPHSPEPLDDFTDLQPLGRGGMGLVFRAHQTSLDREVALKLIRPERLLLPSSLARFQREVETVARLRHPGIVAIHSSGTTRENELPFFAMELLGGATLSTVLGAMKGRTPESLDGDDLFAAIGGAGPLPPSFQGSWPDACLRAVRLVADALAYAHGEEVLHRDVKPSNIMLEPSGRAVLFDFGLTATSSDPGSRMTRSGEPLGTLVYMSPEQLEGRVQLDGRADVYSLGATLYELLALQAPFEGKNAAQVQTAVLAGDVTPLRARNRRVPVDAQTVVLKAMATRRADRYANAHEFAEDLRRVLEKEPIEARPPSLLNRTLRWTQRRPAAALAAALAVILLVGVPLTLYGLSEGHARELNQLVEQESAAKETALAANAELEDVLSFMLRLFEDANPMRNGGDVPDAREMLFLGSSGLAALNDRPSSKARVDLALGRLFSVLTEFERALPHLEAAIAYYEEKSDPQSRARLAEALRKAGHGLLMLRRLPESKQRIDRALAIAEEVHGKGDPKLSGFHTTLASYYRGIGDPQSSVREARRALELLTEAGAGVTGAGGADTAAAESERFRASGMLGVALKEAGDLEAARPLLEEALQWGEEREEIDSERGLFLLTLGDLEKLESNLEQHLTLAQAAAKELKSVHGPESFLTQQAEMAMAEALGRLERYDEALPVITGLADRMTTRLPAHHPAILRTRLLQLAFLNGLGRQTEIAPICTQHDLVKLFDEVHGASHPNTLRVLRALAISHQARGEESESLAALTQLEAAERNASAWSADHADAIFMLAAQRQKLRLSDALNGPNDTAALLQDLLEAVHGSGLQAESAMNGTRYDVEATARGFLAGLRGQEAPTDR